MPGRYQFSLPERPQRDGWVRVGQFDLTTTASMVFLGIASMFLYAADKETAFRLAFFGPLVRDGDYWRLISWPIFNPPNNVFVVLTFVFFWFVGHRIEDLVGKRRFALLLAAMTVLPAAVVSLFQSTSDTAAATGLGSLGIGLLVVYALEHPNAMFFFGIPAWVIAAVLVGIDLLRLLGDRAYGILLLEIGVIVVAVVGARVFGLLGQLNLGVRRRTRAVKPASRGSVVAGPWAAEPVGAATRQADQAALDHLLDKISSGGMDSLTRAEKEQLNELSKRLRDR